MIHKNRIGHTFRFVYMEKMIAKYNPYLLVHKRNGLMVPVIKEAQYFRFYVCNSFVCLLYDPVNNETMSRRSLNKHIRITCPCDLYLLHPTLYSKIGVYRGLHNFLIFALNIDCGYSLEPPH